MKSLNLSKPHLLVVVGLPGAGKSYFAQYFSKVFSVPFISFNKLRSEIFQVHNFDEDEQDLLDRISSLELKEIFKTRATVVYEGLGATKTERRRLAKQAKENGYETLFIWVQTDLAAAKQRATKPTKASTNIILSEDKFAKTLKRFTPLGKDEQHVVVSGKHTNATQLRIVLKKLAEKQPRQMASSPVAIAADKPRNLVRSPNRIKAIPRAPFDTKISVK